jgi:anti-sigma-K factor RskA
MSDRPQRDFDDELATAVMHDDLVAELTARSRDDDEAPLSDEPTKVAKISVAELFAAAGAPVDAPAAAAGLRVTWRRAAVFVVVAAALVATLAVVVGQSFGTR